MSARFLPYLGLSVVLWLAMAAANAEMVRDMYSAQVPVADQSASELTRASRLGLSEVLVRVSGSVAVLDDPLVSEALGSASNRMQRFGYNNDPDEPGKLLVTMLFDSSFVTQLFIEAGLPLWTANRPVLLLWLVQQGPTGRQFVNSETAPLLVKTLESEFARRGVPVQLPLYDLVDTAALGVDEAWALDGLSLEEASSRYNLDNILAGRIEQLSIGQVAGEWLYLSEVRDFRDLQSGEPEVERERVTRSVTSDSETMFIREGVALVAEAMSARYAVSATANEEGLTLAVSGVTEYGDYASIVTWLEDLELVEWANVERVLGDTVWLRVKAQADADQLATLIGLNRRLLAMPATPPGTASAADLNYQWQK